MAVGDGGRFCFSREGGVGGRRGVLGGAFSLKCFGGGFYMPIFPYYGSIRVASFTAWRSHASYREGLFDGWQRRHSRCSMDSNKHP